MSQLNKDAVADSAADADVKTLSGTSITLGDYVNNKSDKDWYGFISTTTAQYTVKSSTIATAKS